MNKYLSTVGLYARWNLYRILVITLVTAALAGVLVWRYPVGTVVLDENYVNPKTGETTTLVASYPRLVSVAAESRATVVCAVGIRANREKMRHNLHNSLMLVTALNPYIGYENAAKTAKKAFRENISLKQACVELGFLSEEEFDRVFHPEEMI